MQGLVTLFHLNHQALQSIPIHTVDCFITTHWPCHDCHISLFRIAFSPDRIANTVGAAKISRRSAVETISGIG